MTKEQRLPEPTALLHRRLRPRERTDAPRGRRPVARRRLLHGARPRDRRIDAAHRDLRVPDLRAGATRRVGWLSGGDPGGTWELVRDHGDVVVRARPGRRRHRNTRTASWNGSGVRAGSSRPAAATRRRTASRRGIHPGALGRGSCRWPTMDTAAGRTSRWPIHPAPDNHRSADRRGQPGPLIRCPVLTERRPACLHAPPVRLTRDDGNRADPGDRPASHPALVGRCADSDRAGCPPGVQSPDCRGGAPVRRCRIDLPHSLAGAPGAAARVGLAWSLPAAFGKELHQVPLRFVGHP
jgi:hypothetical protein